MPIDGPYASQNGNRIWFKDNRWIRCGEESTLNEVTALLAHEMGHALGLGHSTDKGDVMYPIVRAATKLGPGDIAGLQSLLRPCVDTNASRDYPLP